MKSENASENIKIILDWISDYIIDVKKDLDGNISLELEEDVGKYGKFANIIILKFNYSRFEENKKDAIEFFEKIIKAIKELK